VIEEFWRQCCAARGVTAPCPGVTEFGDSPAMQDELSALVVAGVKRATASLARWYGEGAAPWPQPGDTWIFTDGGGVPRGVYETVAVSVTPFAEVDASFAAEEGEGDKSLAYWRASHRRFFTDELAREGLAFSEEMPVVLERFRLLWAPGAG